MQDERKTTSVDHNAAVIYQAFQQQDWFQPETLQKYIGALLSVAYIPVDQRPAAFLIEGKMVGLADMKAELTQFNAKLPPDFRVPESEFNVFSPKTLSRLIIAIDEIAGFEPNLPDSNMPKNLGELVADAQRIKEERLAMGAKRDEALSSMDRMIKAQLARFAYAQRVRMLAIGQINEFIRKSNFYKDLADIEKALGGRGALEAWVLERIDGQLNLVLTPETLRQLDQLIAENPAFAASYFTRLVREAVLDDEFLRTAFYATHPEAKKALENIESATKQELQKAQPHAQIIQEERESLAAEETASDAAALMETTPRRLELRLFAHVAQHAPSDVTTISGALQSVARTAHASLPSPAREHLLRGLVERTGDPEGQLRYLVHAFRLRDADLPRLDATLRQMLRSVAPALNRLSAIPPDTLSHAVIHYPDVLPASVVRALQSPSFSNPETIAVVHDVAARVSTSDAPVPMDHVAAYAAGLNKKTLDTHVKKNPIAPNHPAAPILEALRQNLELLEKSIPKTVPAASARVIRATARAHRRRSAAAVQLVRKRLASTGVRISARQAAQLIDQLIRLPTDDARIQHLRVSFARVPTAAIQTIFQSVQPHLREIAVSQAAPAVPLRPLPTTRELRSLVRKRDRIPAPEETIPPQLAPRTAAASARLVHATVRARRERLLAIGQLMNRLAAAGVRLPADQAAHLVGELVRLPTDTARTEFLRLHFKSVPPLTIQTIFQSVQPHLREISAIPLDNLVLIARIRPDLLPRSVLETLLNPSFSAPRITAVIRDVATGVSTPDAPVPADHVAAYAAGLNRETLDVHIKQEGVAPDQPETPWFKDFKEKSLPALESVVAGPKAPTVPGAPPVSIPDATADAFRSIAHASAFRTRLDQTFRFLRLDRAVNFIARSAPVRAVRNVIAAPFRAVRNFVTAPFRAVGNWIRGGATRIKNWAVSGLKAGAVNIGTRLVTWGAGQAAKKGILGFAGKAAVWAGAKAAAWGMGKLALKAIPVVGQILGLVQEVGGAALGFLGTALKFVRGKASFGDLAGASFKSAGVLVGAAIGGLIGLGVGFLFGGIGAIPGLLIGAALGAMVGGLVSGGLAAFAKKPDEALKSLLGLVMFGGMALGLLAQWAAAHVGALIGGTIGGVVGTYIGYALGGSIGFALCGPLCAIAGGWIGGTVLGTVGAFVGGAIGTAAQWFFGTAVPKAGVAAGQLFTLGAASVGNILSTAGTALGQLFTLAGLGMKSLVGWVTGAGIPSLIGGALGSIAGFFVGGGIGTLIGAGVGALTGWVARTLLTGGGIAGVVSQIGSALGVLGHGALSLFSFGQIALRGLLGWVGQAGATLGGSILGSIGGFFMGGAPGALLGGGLGAIGGSWLAGGGLNALLSGIGPTLTNSIIGATNFLGALTAPLAATSIISATTAVVLGTIGASGLLTLLFYFPFQLSALYIPPEGSAGGVPPEGTVDFGSGTAVDCFKFVAGNTAYPLPYDESTPTPELSDAWTAADATRVTESITLMRATYQKFMDRICSGGEIRLWRDSHHTPATGTTWGGWTMKANDIRIFNNGVSDNLYTLSHELGHVYNIYFGYVGFIEQKFVEWLPGPGTCQGNIYPDDITSEWLCYPENFAEGISWLVSKKHTLPSAWSNWIAVHIFS